jgi:hypothetical protein
MTMTDDERRQRLLDLGLNPDGDSLAHAAAPLPDRPKAQPKGQPKDQAKAEGVRYAPDGIDPHTMAVTEIVFTDEMLDPKRFPPGELRTALSDPSLSGSNYKMASDHLFAQYNSPPRRDHDRNALLHRRITEFLGQVKRSRKTGGFVRERIKATAEQRELTQVMAAGGLDAGQLAGLAELAKELAAKGLTLDDLAALIPKEEKA